MFYPPTLYYDWIAGGPGADEFTDLHVSVTQEEEKKKPTTGPRR